MPALVNPFCRARSVKQPALDNRIIQRVVSMEIDKDTLETMPVYEAVDVVEEIQSCRELCGLEYMKKLLQQGLVKPEDLQDNAGASFDDAIIPPDVHTARRLANKANEELQAIAKATGVQEGQTITAEQLEAMVKAKVAELVAAAKVTSEGGSN